MLSSLNVRQKIIFYIVDRSTVHRCHRSIVSIFEQLAGYNLVILNTPAYLIHVVELHNQRLLGNLLRSKDLLDSHQLIWLPDKGNYG